MLLPLRPADHSLNPIAAAFAFFAGLSWTSTSALERGLHMPSGPSLALGMATASITVLPLAVYDAGLTLLAPSFAALSLGSLISSAIPYSLEMFALKRIPVRRFGALFSLEPAIGAVTAALMLGGTFDGVSKVGDWLRHGRVDWLSLTRNSSLEGYSLWLEAVVMGQRSFLKECSVSDNRY